MSHLQELLAEAFRHAESGAARGASGRDAVRQRGRAGEHGESLTWSVQLLRSRHKPFPEPDTVSPLFPD
jgi:hypothetical protein